MHLKSGSSTVIWNSFFFFSICVQAQGLYMVYVHKLQIYIRVHAYMCALKFKHFSLRMCISIILCP